MNQKILENKTSTSSPPDKPSFDLVDLVGGENIAFLDQKQ